MPPHQCGVKPAVANAARATPTARSQKIGGSKPTRGAIVDSVGFSGLKKTLTRLPTAWRATALFGPLALLLETTDPTLSP